MARKITSESPSDYEVGRGKPPKHTRFQKGKSGNPGGRKRETPNLKTVINNVLTGQIEVSENGRRRKVSVIEAIILRQVQEALGGQPRAIESLLDRYERCADTAEASAQELSEDDLELLERTLGRSRAATGSLADRTGPAADEASPSGDDPQTKHNDGDDGDEGGCDG